MDLTFLVAFIGCAVVVSGYNLEGRLPLYKSGPVNGTFGFSVALHKTSDQPQSSLEKSLLVVGSPTAGPLPTQINTQRPGGIFYCPVTTNPEDCVRVEMDAGESAKIDNKTGQWLGVSLESQGAGGYLVTCAHRYSRRFNTGQNEIERLCGKCFLLNGTAENGLREITPAESGNRFIASPCDQIHDPGEINYKTTLGYAQSGVSVSLVDNEYLSGGPGMWSWSGGMFDFQLPNLQATGADIFVQSSEMHMTLGCRNKELQTTRGTKCDSIPLRRDSYIGFAVETSKAMFADSSDTVYIAGAPRGNYTGSVVMYTKQRATDGTLALHPIMNSILMGDFMGSSYGFSLAVTDLNNDGLDDLLVGAPQYYQYNNDGKYGGAVYVYINDATLGIGNVTPLKLYGPLDSFFGYSVEALGDLDQDGYNDFAVGAPYELPSGKIYIYRGSADGVPKLSQRLSGEDFFEVTDESTGFGVSMSSDVDIDNNRYPDLFVGTLTDRAVLFRARPIITVMSSLSVNPHTINLRQPNCSYGGKLYSCFDVEFCFSYQARHDEYTEALPMEYALTLDSNLVNEGKFPRAFFGTPHGSNTLYNNVTLPSAGVKVCPDGFVRVYFSEESKDRLRPINVDFKFNLGSDNNVIQREAPDDPVFVMIGDPIMDADYPSSRAALVTPLTTCGDDGCQSNLKVNGTLPPEVVVGNTGKITLVLEVMNDGEEAHQAFITAKLPPYVFYDNYTVVESSGAVIECFTTDTGGTTFITCSLGNPYDAQSFDIIAIELDVGSLPTTTKEIVVEATGSTTSSNPEIPPVPLRSRVIIEHLISMAAFPQPQQVRYTNSPIIGESAIYFTDQIGPKLSYSFLVTNNGLNPAKGMQLVVNLPYEILNHKWLLYLVDANVRSGASTVAGICDDIYINELEYHLPNPSGGARKKREAEKPAPLYEPQRQASSRTAGSHGSETKLDCKRHSALCVPVKCTLEPIMPSTTTSVSLQIRLWNNTFLEEFKNIDLVRVITTGMLKSSESNVRINGDTEKQIEITVDHAFFKEDAISIFPWWYILIGIILSLIIYIVIICLLIRCGFFKRKKYPRRPQQPDEHVLVDDENGKINESRA